MEKSEDVYNVVVDPTAAEKLEQHCEFLARVSISATHKLKETLIQDISTLRKMPERCPYYNRPWIKSNQYRWLLSSKRFRIIFIIVNKTVFIDDIQDCRQNDAQQSHY
jgi:hypothetical protein